METSPLKRFLSLNCCLCCGSTNKEKQDDKIKKNENVIKHQELHNKESFGEKDENKNCKAPAGGIPNLAFTKEEDVIIKQPKIVTSQPNTLAQPTAHSRNGSRGVFRDRQISDISAFFAVGEQDPDLTDMVMDELNKSMPILPTKDELVAVPIDVDADSDVFNPANDSDDSVKSELIEDSNERIRESFEFAKKKDKVKNIEDEEYIPPSEKEEKVPPKIEEIAQPTQRSTEWRDKLIENLMNDDIEFELSESESDVSSICSSQASDATRYLDIIAPPSMDDTMKGSTNTAKDISTANTKSYKTPIVLDNGSYEIKLGFAGDLQPEHKVRSLVGKWRDEVSEAWRETYGELLIGEEAINRHSALNIQTPQKDGVVQHWKLMGQLWEKSSISLMETDFKEHPLLVSEPAISSKQQREKTLELAIEKLYCPLVHIKSQAALSALSVGADVVMVVNSGYGYTEVVPVYCGYAVKHAANMVPIGGAHITEYLARLIKKESGHNFSSFAEIEVLNKIKEGHAMMHDGKTHLTPNTKNKPLKHELPDGQVVELKNELTLCTEPLYRPELIGLEAKQGLTHLIRDSVSKLDVDIRQEMCEAVLLSGGTSRLRGFKERINYELNEDSDYKYKSTLADANSAWIGGSLFANEDSFNSNCVSDDMYFEYGSSIVHRMCF